MASFTLYRFRIELSDVDRGVYETLDFRAAMHPSETIEFLLTRVLAYSLSYEDGLEFSPSGLSDPDAPALRLMNGDGTVRISIEIGSPSARRLHRTSKASQQLKVYAYRNPEALLRELQNETIHRRETIQLYFVDSQFLKSLAARLGRDNSWALVHQDGHVLLTFADESSAEGDIVRHPL